MMIEVNKVGKPYSHLYVERGKPATDSAKARRRVHGLFVALFDYDGRDQVAKYLRLKCGLRVPGIIGYESAWEPVFDNITLETFLDIITYVHKFFTESKLVDSATRWRNGIIEILKEENVAYEIDAKCGVHPLVDQEFQHNIETAIAGLGSPRYRNALDLFLRMKGELKNIPPDGKQAWRAIFASLECIFRLMFQNSQRLTSSEIRKHLRPLIRRSYGGDEAQLQAAEKLLDSFEDWVDASHNYRHEPGHEEPAQPPFELAVLAISQGTSFVRFIAELDQAILAQAS